MRLNVKWSFYDPCSLILISGQGNPNKMNSIIAWKFCPEIKRVIFGTPLCVTIPTRPAPSFSNRFSVLEVPVLKISDATDNQSISWSLSWHEFCWNISSRHCGWQSLTKLNKFAGERGNISIVFEALFSQSIILFANVHQQHFLESKVILTKINKQYLLLGNYISRVSSVPANREILPVKNSGNTLSRVIACHRVTYYVFTLLIGYLDKF